MIQNPVFPSIHSLTCLRNVAPRILLINKFYKSSVVVMNTQTIYCFFESFFFATLSPLLSESSLDTHGEEKERQKKSLLSNSKETKKNKVSIHATLSVRALFFRPGEMLTLIIALFHIFCVSILQTLFVSSYFVFCCFFLRTEISRNSNGIQ